MCHLVTLAVQDFPGDLRRRLHDRGFDARPACNPHVRAALPAGSTMLDVTRDGCSCAFYAPEPAAHRASRADAAAAARYRKRGWSEAKIARALAASEAAAAHKAAASPSGGTQFAEAVGEIARETTSIMLFAHGYTERFESEPVVSVGRLEMTIEDFVRDGGAFPEDTVVCLRSA